MQLDLEDVIVHTESQVISWPPSERAIEATAHVQAYNWNPDYGVLPDGPETFATVPLRQSVIDWESIFRVTKEGKHQQTPSWLLPLFRRLATVQRLEQLARLHAPIAPVPNPLRIEIVLGGGFGKDAYGFQALTLQGENTLKMIHAITYYMLYPYDDARRLDDRVSAAMNPERLATLMAGSGLLAEVMDDTKWLPRMDGVKCDAAYKMLLALVGAYFWEKGSDFYSVAMLWHSTVLTCRNELLCLYSPLMR